MLLEILLLTFVDFLRWIFSTAVSSTEIWLVTDLALWKKQFKCKLYRCPSHIHAILGHLAGRLTLNCDISRYDGRLNRGSQTAMKFAFGIRKNLKAVAAENKFGRCLLTALYYRQNHISWKHFTVFENFVKNFIACSEIGKPLAVSAPPGLPQFERAKRSGAFRAGKANL